jgi:hypothetical protein
MTYKLAAMVNDMNCYGVLNRIKCVEHTPITHAELEQILKRASQLLRLNLIEMLSKPLDLSGNALSN